MDIKNRLPFDNKIADDMRDVNNARSLFFNSHYSGGPVGMLAKKLAQGLTRPVLKRQVDFNLAVREVLAQATVAIVDLEREVNELRAGTIKTERQAREKSGFFFNDPLWLDFTDDGEAQWTKTSERILERAFVFQSLVRLYETRDVAVLDVGAAESLIAYELASLGYNVTATDIRPTSLSHPNLKFVQGDICKPAFPAASFDCAIALSTVEHIGLGWYGDEAVGQDIQAVEQIHGLLKPGGRFILTVPYGKAAITPVHRIYGADTLQTLVRPFRVDRLEYGIRLDDRTFVTTSEASVADAQEHDAITSLPGAVAMLVCAKS